MPATSKINSDLQAERNSASFDVQEFTNWYYGGAEKVAEKKFFGKICKKFKKAEM